MSKRMMVIPAVDRQKLWPEQSKLRVCAYARVSKKFESQESSCEAQISYYMQKIKNNPLWEFAGIYADHGVTGTQISRRDEFKTMLEECEKGNIDLILTKSVSRFCRNVIDCLMTVRRLKSMGVGVWFEKENINTLTGNSELFLSVLAAVAQAESEEKGGNNRWSVIRRFEEGNFTIAVPAFGYENDSNGNMVHREDEAEIVKWIFYSYLNGIGTYQIAKLLNAIEIQPIRNGKKWTYSTVNGILRNPVYEGDLLLQKTYRDKSFPHSCKKNKGELDQYLVSNDHEPIVARETMGKVNRIMDYRRNVLNSAGKGCTNRYVFSGKIVCSECGSSLRRKQLYGGKKIVWSCVKHVEDKLSCKMKAIGEEDIQHAFVEMWNKLYTNKGEILEPYLEGLKKCPTRAYMDENEKLDKEIEQLAEQCRILTHVMREGYIDTAIYMDKYNQTLVKLTDVRRRKNLLMAKQRQRTEIVKTEQFIELLEREDHILNEFREELFEYTVRLVKISINHDITFCLHNGLELTELCWKNRR